MGDGGAPPSSNMRVSGEWDVEYSRFFNFPTPSSYSFHSSDLRVLSRTKSRAGGTWITASSLAALRLRDPSHPVLSVSVPGIIYEEHFISNLNITCPEHSCRFDTQGGGRVVFLSFRDDSNQVQKFAVRFLACVEVKTFLKYVKELSRDVIDLEDSEPKHGKTKPCETATSEQTTNRHKTKIDVGSPASTLKCDATATESLQTPVTNCSLGVLPPSFKELIVGCSKKNIEDVLARMEGAIAVLGDDASL